MKKLISAAGFQSGTILKTFSSQGNQGKMGFSAKSFGGG